MLDTTKKIEYAADSMYTVGELKFRINQKTQIILRVDAHQNMLNDLYMFDKN